MAGFVDLTGLEVTCSNEEALRYYNEAMELFVGQLQKYLPPVEKALRADPSFIMARCFRVCKLITTLIN